MNIKRICEVVALLLVMSAPIVLFSFYAGKTIGHTNSMSSTELDKYDVDHWTGQLIYKDK
jgi:hypothetical protein